jgi:hypothetical protein
MLHVNRLARLVAEQNSKEDRVNVRHPGQTKVVGPRSITPGMIPEPPASVFASYSRTDALLVRDLVGLFAAVDVPVFRDEQSIKPGRKWRVEIDAALEQCQVILVFWCAHAAQSSEVRSEYERAISLDKRVVPVLIDHTALPPPGAVPRCRFTNDLGRAAGRGTPRA